MAFFGALNITRICLLSLSAHGVIAQRIRIIDGSVVIEIDRPLQIGSEPTIKQDYAAVDLNGCSVAWKLEREKA